MRHEMRFEIKEEQEGGLARFRGLHLFSLATGATRMATPVTPLSGGMRSSQRARKRNV